VVVQLWFGPLRFIARTVSDSGVAWRNSRVHAEMLATVEPGSRVTASLGFLSHLAKREDLQSIQLVSMGLQTLGGGRYVPRPSDEALVDFSDEFTFSTEAGSMHPKMQTKTGELVPSSDALMHRWLKDNSLWPVTVRGSVTHFSKSEPVTASLVATSARRIDENTQLLSIVPSQAAEGDLLNWKLTWAFSGERSFIPWVKLWLRAANGESHYIVKGPAIPGVELGQFTETWTIPHPNIPPGAYKGFLITYDPASTGGKSSFEPVGFEVGNLEVK
jgi:hypothetical protein